MDFIYNFFKKKEFLGVNQVHNMDCLDGIKRVQSSSVKLIIADPPYFLGMTHNGSKGNFVDLAICKTFYQDLFQEFKRVLRVDGVVMFFCDWRGYAFYYPVFDGILGAKNLIVWDKISGPGDKLSYAHELIMCHFGNKFSKGGSNVWRIPSFTSGAQKKDGSKVHSTQKALEIIEKMVLDFSDEGDLVLDPFLGSGTSAIAARKHGRDFIGFELDENNFSILETRLEKHKILKLN
jgi:site-specific DNA-methyltransferase (adenine-specific)